MSPERSQCIRLLSYNIHGCVGRGGREDPEGILEIIREADADFVALQEVQDHDAADLSFLRGVEKLAFAEVIYGETMKKPLGAYGNLLLSRHALSSVKRRDISFRRREPRGIIEVRSDAYDLPVRLLATHLGLWRSERSAQIQKLLACRSGEPAGAHQAVDILMGDMNEWFPLSRNIKSLQDHYAWHSTINTFPARMPLFSLDRIFVDGPIKSVRFARIESRQARRVSDHLPLVAEVRINKQ